MYLELELLVENKCRYERQIFILVDKSQMLITYKRLKYSTQLNENITYHQR